jgi:hypothetical protein
VLENRYIKKEETETKNKEETRADRVRERNVQDTNGIKVERESEMNEIK